MSDKDGDIEDFSEGNSRIITQLCKELFTDKLCNKKGAISDIISKKLSLFKRFLLAMQNHDSHVIESIWSQNGEEGRRLVELLMTITVNKSLEVEEERVQGGVIMSYDLSITASHRHTLVVDEIVCTKLFKKGLKPDC